MRTTPRTVFVLVALTALVLEGAAVHGVQGIPDTSLVGTWGALVDFSSDPYYDIEGDMGVFGGSWTIDSLVVGQPAGSFQYPKHSITGSLVFTGVDNGSTYVFQASSKAGPAVFRMTRVNSVTLSVVDEWRGMVARETFWRMLEPRTEMFEQATLADTVVVGRSEPLRLEVKLAGPAADGTYPPLLLELVIPGVSEEVPFTHLGQGRYIAEASVVLPVNGEFRLPVWLIPANGPPVLLYSFALTVLPGRDLVVHADGPAPGWLFQTVGFGNAADPQAADPLTVGKTVLALRGVGRGKLFCRAPEPFSSVGYDTLRMMVLPGGAAPTLLAGMVNRMRPVGGALRQVDWSLQQWQILSIPLGSLGLNPMARNADHLGLNQGQAVSSVGFDFNVKGTFYLADVRLVTSAQPALTAVHEAYSPVRPRAFALAQNHPNPFNSDTLIRFSLPTRAQVSLTLYNLTGQQVATLVEGARDGGEYEVTWDGRSPEGGALASGVYLYHLQVGGQGMTRKLLLLR